MEIEEAIEIVLDLARSELNRQHFGTEDYGEYVEAIDTVEDFFNWIDATSIWTYNVREKNT